MGCLIEPQELRFSTMKARSSFWASQWVSALLSQPSTFILSFPPCKPCWGTTSIPRVEAEAPGPLSLSWEPRRGRAGCCTLELPSTGRLGWSSWAVGMGGRTSRIINPPPRPRLYGNCGVFSPLSGQVSWAQRVDNSGTFAFHQSWRELLSALFRDLGCV